MTDKQVDVLLNHLLVAVAYVLCSCLMTGAVIGTTVVVLEFAKAYIL